MIRNTLKIAFSALLAAVFLWASFRNVEWSNLWQTFATASPWGLVGAAILVIFSCIPRAWRWLLLLEPVSNRIGLGAALKAVLIAYAGNNVFPRAGEVARVISLSRDYPISASATLATVVVERLLDMLVLLLLFAVVLLFARDQIASAFPGLETIGLIGLILILLILIGLGILSALGERGLVYLNRLLAPLPPALSEKLVHLFRAFLQGMGAIHSFKAYAGIFLSTLVINACYLFSIYLPLYSFDLPGRFDLGLFEALVIMVISTVGIVIPIPGGTGTYHFFCSSTLRLFYGVPQAEALAFATAVHGIAFLSLLILGGPPLLHLLWFQKQKEQKVDQPSAP